MYYANVVSESEHPLCHLEVSGNILHRLHVGGESAPVAVLCNKTLKRLRDDFSSCFLMIRASLPRSLKHNCRASWVLLAKISRLAIQPKVYGHLAHVSHQCHDERAHVQQAKGPTGLSQMLQSFSCCHGNGQKGRNGVTCTKKSQQAVIRS